MRHQQSHDANAHTEVEEDEGAVAPRGGGQAGAAVPEYKPPVEDESAEHGTEEATGDREGEDDTELAVQQGYHRHVQSGANPVGADEPCDAANLVSRQSSCALHEEAQSNGPGGQTFQSIGRVLWDVIEHAGLPEPPWDRA